MLPEYYLTGFPLRESREEWKAKASVDMDGPEYEALAAIAERFGVYLAGNLYENDPAFPDLYFRANTVIAPNGATVLRYRRMLSQAEVIRRQRAIIERLRADGVLR